MAMAGSVGSFPAQGFDGEGDWEDLRYGADSRRSESLGSRSAWTSAASGGWRQSAVPLFDSRLGSIDFLSRQAGPYGGDEWGISARYRARPLKTEFRFYWLYLRERNAYPPEFPGMGFAPPMNGPGLGNEPLERRNTGLFSLPLEEAPKAAGERQNPFSYLASARLQLSAIYALPSTTLWDSADLRLEAGRLRRSGKRNGAATDPGSRQSRAVQVMFTPAWSDPLPNLELSLPVSLSYSLKSEAPLPGFEGRYKGGRFSIGASAVYEKAWNADLRYIRFLGEATSPVKDRNFIWLSIQRNF